jgi:predicted phosphodiesterase
MRLGIVADVHGNLRALEAVVAALDDRVDAFVCAGDLVGYGPFPNECVAAVASLRGLTCVAGNHDLIALGRLSDERCIPLARETLVWTARVLDESARAFLAGLPVDARPTPSLLLTHGAPGDPEEYVRTPERGRELLDGLGEAERFLVLGHTHEPWELRHGARTLLNPGSVGQSRSRDPRARFAILDVEEGRAELLAVEYDAEATRRALRERGLPEDACHLSPPPAVRRVAGKVRRAVGL